MTLVEAALAWRDLLADTWVGRAPRRSGEDCLVICQPMALWRPFEEFLRERDVVLDRSVAEWMVNYNDAPGRTKQEALDLVDDFARWLKERER